MTIATLSEFEPTYDSIDAEHTDPFERDRLMPAIRGVAGDDAARPLRQVSYELHRVLKGR